MDTPGVDSGFDGDMIRRQQVFLDPVFEAREVNAASGQDDSMWRGDGQDNGIVAMKVHAKEARGTFGR